MKQTFSLAKLKFLYPAEQSVTKAHLGSRPCKGADIVQGGQELAVHDLGQAHICDLSCVVSGQQDVGRLEIKVHNLPGVQKVQTSRHIQSYASAQPW